MAEGAGIRSGSSSSRALHRICTARGLQFNIFASPGRPRGLRSSGGRNRGLKEKERGQGGAGQGGGLHDWMALRHAASRADQLMEAYWDVTGARGAGGAPARFCPTVVRPACHVTGDIPAFSGGTTTRAVARGCASPREAPRSPASPFQPPAALQRPACGLRDQQPSGPAEEAP